MSSRKTDQCIKKLAEMVIDGKDWPLEDCLADGEDWPMPGATSQSVLKGYNPFRCKQPVPICDNIEEQYGVAGTFNFVPGEAALGMIPKDAVELWAVYLRQKAALEANERKHRKQAAEIKASHESAIAKILSEVDDLVSARVGAANSSGADTAAAIQTTLEQTLKEKKEMEEQLQQDKEKEIADVAAVAFREVMQAWQAAVHMGIHRWMIRDMLWGINRWKQSTMNLKFKAETQSKLNESSVFGSTSYIPKPAKSASTDLMAQFAAAEAMWMTSPKSSKSSKPRKIDTSDEISIAE